MIPCMLYAAALYYLDKKIPLYIYVIYNMNNAIVPVTASELTFCMLS